MTYTYQETDRVLEPFEAAWLACAVDSEGSVTASFTRYRRLFVVPRITVTNTNEDFINYAHALMCRAAGGANKGRVHAGTNMPVLRAEVSSGKRAAPVLFEILPFLIVKRERAEALMAYIRARHQTRPDPAAQGGNAPYGIELDRLCAAFGREVTR